MSYFALSLNIVQYIVICCRVSPRGNCFFYFFNFFNAVANWQFLFDSFLLVFSDCRDELLWVIVKGIRQHIPISLCFKCCWYLVISVSLSHFFCSSEMVEMKFHALSSQIYVNISPFPLRSISPSKTRSHQFPFDSFYYAHFSQLYAWQMWSNTRYLWTYTLIHSSFPVLNICLNNTFASPSIWQFLVKCISVNFKHGISEVIRSIFEHTLWYIPISRWSISPSITRSHQLPFDIFFLSAFDSTLSVVEMKQYALSLNTYIP